MSAIYFNLNVHSGRKSGSYHFNIVDIIQYLCYRTNPELTHKKKERLIDGGFFFNCVKRDLCAQHLNIPVPRIIDGML